MAYTYKPYEEDKKAKKEREGRLAPNTPKYGYDPSTNDAYQQALTGLWK